MTQLIIYSSAGTAAQIKGAADVYYKNPSATVKDVKALSTTIGGDVETWIGTLVDGTYDEIFILCDSQAALTAGTMAFSNIALLRAKMKTAKKGTVVDDGTCQANSTVTDIILAATASASNDTYNGMYIETAGTTAVVRYISDYVGSSRTAKVLTTTQAITTTETYEVYTNDYIYELGNTNATSGKKAVLQAWDVIYPDVTYPLFNSYIGGYQFCQNLGTAQAVAAGTVTLAASIVAGGLASQTEHDTDDFYKNMWVYVYSASTGAAQYAKITAYNATTKVATLAANWRITPTGTLVYRIVDNEKEVFNDRAAEIAVSTLMYDITHADVKPLNVKLIDQYLSLNNVGATETFQDTDYIWNDLLVKAKFAFAADSLSVI